MQANVLARQVPNKVACHLQPTEIMRIFVDGVNAVLMRYATV